MNFITLSENEASPKSTVFAIIHLKSIWVGSSQACGVRFIFSRANGNKENFTPTEWKKKNPKILNSNPKTVCVQCCDWTKKNK